MIWAFTKTNIVRGKIIVGSVTVKSGMKATPLLVNCWRGKEHIFWIPKKRPKVIGNWTIDTNPANGLIL